MKILLRNGRILDPSQDIDTFGSVVIEDGQITEVGPEVNEEGADEAYECRGLWIAPGLVDLDCRLWEPGFTHRESIQSGTRAAAAGGFTTLCVQPNTSPALDAAALVSFLQEKASAPDAGGVFVAALGALTLGQEGQRLSNFSSLKKAGAVGVCDEGGPLQSAGLMSRAMSHCVQLDLPLLAHCEDLSLSSGGAMNEGAVSALLGLKGIPRTAEEALVWRNASLSQATGCPTVLQRVSTWGSVMAVRQFKEMGAPVSCTVLPQHFCFSEADMLEFDPSFKAFPPLRTPDDVALIQQAIGEGVIDVIASGHCPYAPYEVDVPFSEAPFGFPGLETTLAATLTHLTQKGILSPLETIRRLSTSPAELLRLEAGTLKPEGTPLAQVVVIDPNLEWTFDASRSFSRGKSTPFHGARFSGKAVLTFVGAEIYRDPALPSSRYEGS